MRKVELNGVVPAGDRDAGLDVHFLAGPPEVVAAPNEIVAGYTLGAERDRRTDISPHRHADTHTRRLSAQSWLRREAHAANERTLRLTTVQREVLALICQGKSNPDIAHSRKRSLHTIRNLVARLFVIFGVSSREELAVECVRRGLYAPK